MISLNSIGIGPFWYNITAFLNTINAVYKKIKIFEK